MPKKSAIVLAAITVVTTGGTALATNDEPRHTSTSRECGTENFNITTRETPGHEHRIVEIDLIAKPGTTCELGGYPRELTFYRPDGERLTVPTRLEDSDARPVTVDESRPGFVYLTLPRSDAPQSATSASFVLSFNGEDTLVDVPWHHGVDGPVEISPIG